MSVSRDHLGELARQRAAVAEQGERIGQRLVARGPQHHDVLAEGERQAGHHGHHRGGGEARRQRVEVGHGAVDEEAEGEHPEAERHGDQAQALVRRAHGAGRRLLPRRDGDQEQPGPPAGIDPAARDERPLGGADEVERVGQPERGEADREQDPGAVQAPAGAGQRADDQPEHDQVADADRRGWWRPRAPGPRRCRGRSRTPAPRSATRRRARRRRRRPTACAARHGHGPAAAAGCPGSRTAAAAGSRCRPARGSGCPPRSTGRPCSSSRRATRPARRRRSGARPGAPGRGEGPGRGTGPRPAAARRGARSAR